MGKLVSGVQLRRGWSVYFSRWCSFFLFVHECTDGSDVFRFFVVDFFISYFDTFRFPEGVGNVERFRGKFCGAF